MPDELAKKREVLLTLRYFLEGADSAAARHDRISFDKSNATGYTNYSGHPTWSERCSAHFTAIQFWSYLRGMFVD